MCNYSDVIENKGVGRGYNKAQVDMAERMIKSGEPEQKIVDYSGLTKEKVNLLKKEIMSMA